MTHTSKNLIKPSKFFKSQIEFSEGLEWLLKNTNFPTFEEFKKNPNKWRERKEELFECLDTAAIPNKENLQKLKFFWRGKYFCKSLENLQTVAEKEGFMPNEIEMQPFKEFLNGTSEDKTDFEIRVNVYPKEELKQMGGVVANA